MSHIYYEIPRLLANLKIKIELQFFFLVETNIPLYNVMKEIS